MKTPNDIEREASRMVEGKGKYEPIRASHIYIRPAEGGELRVTTETQLDRIEKKLDSILEKMEGKELPFSIDGKKIAENVMKEIDKTQGAKRIFYSSSKSNSDKTS